MGLTEVEIPTGYTWDLDGVEALSGSMALVEAAQSGGVAIYWHEVQPSAMYRQRLSADVKP